MPDLRPRRPRRSPPRRHGGANLAWLLLGAVLLGLPAAATNAQAPAVVATAGPLSPIPHAYVQYGPPTGAHTGADPLAPDAGGAGAGIAPAALTHLMLRANMMQSDAVVVVKDGKLVADERFRRPAGPIELMSVTKSVAGLAIGRLLYTGKIRSLDEKVATWYPEWQGGPKQDITLRQLMNHTSGLRANPSAEEVYASRDLVRLALDADLAHPPGTHFFYNNKAVNLLAGIVEKASGQKLDEYMRDALFAPLGITRFAWMRDPAGNPHVLAGLQLDARDLARVGQLMLDGGIYNGRRLLGADFVQAAVQTAQPFSPTGGLLWWVLPAWSRLTISPELLATWRQGGAEASFLAALAPLAGKEIERDELFRALGRAFGKDQALDVWVRNVPGRDLPTPKTIAGPPVGFDANGMLGQYLVVLPASRLVAVRLIRQGAQKPGDTDFDDFPDLVRALAAGAEAPRPAGNR